MHLAGATTERTPYVITIWRDGIEPYWATTAFEPRQSVSQHSGHLVLDYVDMETGAPGSLFVSTDDTLIVCPAASDIHGTGPEVGH